MRTAATRRSARHPACVINLRGCESCNDAIPSSESVWSAARTHHQYRGVKRGQMRRLAHPISPEGGRKAPGIHAGARASDFYRTRASSALVSDCCTYLSRRSQSHTHPARPYAAPSRRPGRASDRRVPAAPPGTCPIGRRRCSGITAAARESDTASSIQHRAAALLRTGRCSLEAAARAWAARLLRAAISVSCGGRNMNCARKDVALGLSPYAFTFIAG